MTDLNESNKSVNFTDKERVFLFEKIFKNLKKEDIAAKLKIIIFGILLVAEIVVISIYVYKLTGTKTIEGDKNVAVIKFDKQVTQDYVFEIIQKLSYVEENKEKYSSLLFLMNSPGGSPEASEELSEYLKWFNKEVKPVTMYINGMAASGGYYIASAVKPLKANKNSVVGSIGVILQHFNVKPLADKLGVESDNISYGKHKELIPLIGEATPTQREFITKNLLSKVYKNFIESVATNRDIKVEKLEEFAQGKVFTANDPKIKNILIDEVTSLIQVKNELKTKYGQDIKFVDIELEEDLGFLSGLLKNKLNIDFKISESLSSNKVLLK